VVEDALTPTRSRRESGQEARRSRAVGITLLLIASVMWSLSGVAVKVVNVDSIAFAFWRSAGAALAMLPLAPFASGMLPRWNMMLLSIALYTAVVTLLITAMTGSSAGTGILLQYTGPIFCALFAWMFFRRRITPRTMLALVVGVAGVLVIVFAGSYDARVIAVGVLSGVAFGGLILVLQRIESTGNVNTFAVIFLNNLGCTLLLLPVCWGRGVVQMEAWKLLLILATGVVQLAFPYVLFQLALRRVGPVEASLLILLEPVLNPVWVWLAVGERPDAATFVGGAAILAAMVLEATKPPSRVSEE
jgi:drug/metabolite transporter (DMT)-like permease